MGPGSLRLGSAFGGLQGGGLRVWGSAYGSYSEKLLGWFRLMPGCLLKDIEKRTATTVPFRVEDVGSLVRMLLTPKAMSCPWLSLSLTDLVCLNSGGCVGNKGICYIGGTQALQPLLPY